MAVFTMELKDVIETIFNESDDPFDWEQPYEEFTFGDTTYGKLPIVSDYAMLGLGTYPIFDETYRPILNGKIIDHFYVREIGSETIDMWQLFMRRKMDQIMPYYNQLYKSLEIEYGPLDTMRIHSVRNDTQVGEENVTGESGTKTETKGEARAVGSEMPQTTLSGSGEYATSASDSNSKSDVESTANQESTSSNSTESNGDTLVTGFQGVSSDLVMRYRASLINVDANILLELEDQFMQILNSGDAYTPYGGF